MTKAKPSQPTNSLIPEPAKVLGRTACTACTSISIGVANMGIQFALATDPGREKLDDYQQLMIQYQDI